MTEEEIKALNGYFETQEKVTSAMGILLAAAQADVLKLEMRIEKLEKMIKKLN